MRFLRDAIKSNFKRFFEFGQRLGVDVLPRHFYSSIPDFRELRRDDRWRKPYEMTGVAGADVDEQIVALRGLMNEPVRSILRAEPIYQRACDANGEPGYGHSDADVLFAFIFTNRPAKIVQIGCGVSTAVIVDAAKHAGYLPQLICVDPFPTSLIRSYSTSGTARLIAQKAQHVPADELADLHGGDLLFVDSSHTTSPGSDVNHIVFNVLPRLAAGVHVHFHDVQFPYDFGPNILGPADLFFGGESLLLHAYLINNPRCRIAISLSMIHHARPDALRELLPNYTPITTERGLNPASAYGLSPSATYLLTTC